MLLERVSLARGSTYLASQKSKNVKKPCTKAQNKMLGKDKLAQIHQTAITFIFHYAHIIAFRSCHLLQNISSSFLLFIHTHTHTHLCLAAVSCALPLVLVVAEPAGEALVWESPEPNPSALTSRHSISREHDLTKTKWQRETISLDMSSLETHNLCRASALCMHSFAGSNKQVTALQICLRLLSLCSQWSLHVWLW